MNPLSIARWQFAITTVYHFIFVPITIGSGFLVAGLQTAWFRTHKEKYLRATKFFGKLFLINFAIGVVTGIVQEFQFGMNWSSYSRFVGDIFGAPLAMVGNPDARDREIEQILEIVELADLVHSLPEGLDTLVGNLGYNFSGGEKQRIKLARMLMRNSPIYLLDEPFEYLDHFQADRLTRKVLKVLSTKTVVMVSHTY